MVAIQRTNTFLLTRGPKTEYWVGISSNPNSRISPNGANSMEVDSEKIKGMTIHQIECFMENRGFRLCRVGLVKIWFEKIVD